MSSPDLITNSTCDGWTNDVPGRAQTLLQIDPATLDDAALAQHTLEFQRLRSQIDAVEMRVLHAASSRRVHQVDRHRSTGTWLAAELRGLLEALVSDQELLLRWATTETFATFREFFEAWCILNDPRDPALLDQKAFDDRHMIWVEGVDGAVMIEVDITNLAFAQIQASLQPQIHARDARGP